VQQCGSVAAVRQGAAVRAVVCGSAHGRLCAVHAAVCTAAVCGSALGSVFVQHGSAHDSVRQCAAVCGSVRQCAAVCGCAAVQ
jgi:hypothetical protein